MASNLFDIGGVALEDENGDIFLAKGATVPSDATAGYAKGCVFVDTDGGVGTTFYVNEGSNTSSDFNLAAGEGSATAYDDIGNPDANTTIAFAGFTNTWTSTLDSGTVFTLSNTDADLAADTRLIDLKFTDDGDANGIFLRCLDNSGADVKFSIGADGATTIAGNAAGTDALTLTAGDITVTSGAINVGADSQNITFGAAGSTDSYIQFNGSDLIFYDSTLGGTRTLSQLAGAGLVSPTITGDMTISDGKFNWTDASDEVAGTWTFNNTTGNDIAISSAVTTGNSLSIVANSMTSGSVIYVESSAAGLTTGNYFEAHDGAATIWEVGDNGVTTIAGAAATDVLILTAGDLQITAGDIDLDLGIITVDNTADEGNKIARNNATGTAPVLEVEQTHATGGVAFLVDQNATGDVNAIEITNAGTGFSVTSTGGAAGSEGFEFIGGSAGTGIGLLLDGATAVSGWVGAASTGFLQVTSDGTLANATAALARLAFSGTSASGGAGTCLRVEDTSTSGGGTEYAVYISSTNSEALHVDAGVVQFDEAVTIGVNDTGADFKVFGATAAKFMVWDESADDLILADGVALQLGGDESTADGFKLEFDGTSTLALDALTANDSFIIGATTNTDVSLQGGTAGADVDWDASGNTLTVTTGATLKVNGAAAGDGTTGLEIPTHATATPAGAPGAGSIMYEIDAAKLWIYDGTTWKGVTLA